MNKQSKKALIVKQTSKIEQLEYQNEHLRQILMANQLNEIPTELNGIKQNRDYEYLVLSGGGIKGLAYVGAFQELDKMGILFDIDKKIKIKGIAASSAGTIIASLFAIGYDVSEITKKMADIDFNAIADDKFGYIRDSYNFITKYGICKGQYIYDLMGKLIEEKTGNPDYTLADLYKEKNVRLIITATNKTTNKIVYLHAKHQEEIYANIPIRKCVRMSTSVPFLFEPYEYNNCLFCDGGVLDNYPIDCFDVEDPNNMEEVFMDVTPNFKTLGLKITTRKSDEEKVCKINNIYEYSCSYIDTFLKNNDKKTYLKMNLCRTAFIRTPSYPLKQFSLSEAQKNELLNAGQAGIVDYFK